MKQSKFLTRLLALALALVMIVTNANLGLALQVFAADGKTTVEAGVVVADNYELSEAEENLLRSGYLTGKVEYDNFDETGLVSVSGKQIIAQSYKGWVPVSAAIVVDDEVKETVDLTQTDSFTGDYEAFSVVVEYALNAAVAEQAALLNAAANLKAALADAAAAGDLGLDAVALAMGTLKELAAGMKVETPFGEATVQFGPEAAAAVESLAVQMDMDGTLALQEMNAAYAASEAKLQYLHSEGAGLANCIAATYRDLLAIYNDQEVINNELVNTALADNAAWTGFKNGIKELTEAVGALKDAKFDCSALGNDLTVDAYKAVEALVAAVDAPTAVNAKETLYVARAEAAFNQAMYTILVNVTVELPDGTSLGNTAAFAVKENAELIDVQPKVDARVAMLKDSINVPFEHFEVVSATTLPTEVTENIFYNVVYKAKNYTVTYGAGYVETKTETVPYGTLITLPLAGNGKSFDYTVNGEAVAEGETIRIAGDTQITRVSGKAYAKTDLYSVIADAYASDIIAAILKSGSVKNDVANENVSVRKPDPADVEDLLLLVDDRLTVAESYPSSYRGYNWAPYTYTVDGSEPMFFTGSSVANNGGYSDVTYRLILEHISEAQVASVLNMGMELRSQTSGQIEMLNSLVGYKADMSTLSGGLLSMLNGLIQDTVFVADEAENAKIQDHFLKYTAEIKSKCMANNQLKLYPLVEQYDSVTGGLRYYYENSAAFLAELGALSEVLTAMLPNEEYEGYMTRLVESFESDPFLAAYAPYAEKIPTLKDGIVEINEKLTAPDTRIIMGDNLGKLIAALTAQGEAAVEANPGKPFIVSETLRAMDKSKAEVQVKVVIGDKTYIARTNPIDKEDVVDGLDISHLEYEVEKFINETLGNTREFYVENADGDYKALEGKQLEKTVTITITCNPIEYTVVIGDKTEKIDVTDLEVSLPKHPDSKWANYYYIDGAKLPYGNYTFTTEQLKSLFVDRKYVVVVEAIDEANQKLEGAFGGTTEEDNVYYEFVKDDKGTVVGVNAYVTADQAGLFAFAENMAKSGFGYIGLNGESLLYTVESEGVELTEVSLQTLVNAMLNDAEFGSEKLIELGKAGNGVLLTSTMQLGPNGNGEDLYYAGNELTFKMILKSTPAMMTKVANGLEAVRNYMTFKAVNGELAVELNLPEKVYEVYLTALLATGDLRVTNMNAINNEIAFMFFYDYLEIIMNSDADAQSFQNTLDMIYNVADNVVNPESLPAIDLAKYDPYYQIVKKAFQSTNVSTDADTEKQIITVNATDDGLNEVLDVFGLGAYLDAVSFITVKELSEGQHLTVTAKANLRNTNDDLEAAVFDLVAMKNGVVDLTHGVDRNTLVGLVQGKGVANGVDFTYDLVKRLDEVKGNSIVVLLGDVKGDLHFDRAAILDLNGHNVDGNITADGNLIIVDSTPATFHAGTVTGTVSGHAHILAGQYTGCDVSKYLKDGYLQNEKGYVQNALYWFEKDGVNLTVVLNSDYMYSNAVEGYLPSMTTLAADIATDLSLKYFAPAAVSIDGYSLYSINMNELIGLLNSSDKIDDVISMIVGTFSAKDLAGLANSILHDLVDFRGMYNALKNNEVIGDYLVTTTPWAVKLGYVAESDHIDIGVGASENPAHKRNANIGIKIVGLNKDRFLELLCELRDILSLDTQVDLKQPSYNGESNTLYVAGGVASTLTANLFNSCTYSNVDYLSIFAVLFAHSGAENAPAMIAALNAGDLDAVKDAFDEMTVEDVFTAMKELDKPHDFVKLAANAGLNLDVAAANHLESLYHLIVCATGKVLEHYDITGLDKKLGGLDKDDDGTYELSFTAKRHSDASARGYTVDVDVQEVTMTLEVVIFQTCLWGDANHDGFVDATDASLILQYSVGDELPVFCTLRTDVNGDGFIDATDASEVLRYTVGLIDEFYVEKH